MAKSKVRFNLVDVIIILVIIAAAFAVYNAVTGRNDAEASKSVTLRYVIKTEAIGGGLENNITSGSPLYSDDGIIKYGTVVSYEVRPEYHSGKDTASGELVINPVEGKYTIYLTVEAKATLTEHSYRVDGMEIYVGKEFKAMTPDLLFKCQCINIAEKD